MIHAGVAEPLEAEEPPELRGADRGDVALLVASRADGRLVHARFGELGRFLRPGDLVVVNTSATLAAALRAKVDGEDAWLHLSTRMGVDSWVVELRSSDLLPFSAPGHGARIELPGGAEAKLLAPYLGSRRLSFARLSLGEPLEDYLDRHGQPIRYRHMPREWPIDAYQTVFALDPGSAEMPSAARPFTGELVAELAARGVLFAPVTLHAGVSSLELGESPYPECYRVPAETARLVNTVRGWGGRVIAVGTTVVRALETVAGPGGVLRAGQGLTNLVVTPQRGVHAVDGLITGWHEPSSSHLLLLEAAAGPDLLSRSYAAAEAHGYRFHEFGDSHLILP
ncbi:MAG TPA: S-adenosylmethionine:tRNA ribosyltransferase-isomerase [Thermoleophilaceae bacterium]|nr:S-adenosylmethionine:tRNA ribosyltransferase-isomerase [Thermoleophilaceae bacterium]